MINMSRQTRTYIFDNPFPILFSKCSRIPTHLNLPKPFIQYYNSLSSELSIYTFDKPHLYSYAFEDFHASLHSSFPSNPSEAVPVSSNHITYNPNPALQCFHLKISFLFIDSMYVSGRCCSGRKSAHCSYFRFYTFYVEKSRRRPGLWENPLVLEVIKRKGTISIWDNIINGYRQS